VRRIIQTHRFEPGRLELELTETALAGSDHDVRAAITALRALGARIALDDFGTGYSSLTYLLNFAFDKLKIDRCFVQETDMTSATIVHAVASIGRALGMTLVAEGVETEVQERFLAAAGVHQLQGYRFGKPMPIDAFRRHCAAHPMPQRQAG
jgi:EAL domain-containing protein (putative c-di-GMP-specific phosphodiesterase class I)